MFSGGYKLWKKMTFFVAFPAVGLGMINAYLAHQEHAHEPQPEFKPYDFLRIRSKVELQTFLNFIFKVVAR